MRTKLVAIPLLSAFLLTSCATMPAGPSVTVLPGQGKPFDQFQVDDASCRQWAQQQVGTTPSQASAQNTVAGAAIGTLLGAAAGAAIGAAAGNPGMGAAAGAGVGLLGGTAVGASSANATAGSIQQRYDSAYVQCMYAKGHQVPVRGGMSRASYSTRPAGPPPPPPPPPPPAGAHPTGVPLPPPGTPPPPPPGPSR